jgi:signal transduction histidine kinase
VPAEQAGTLFAMGLKETERLEHMVENVLLSGQLRTRTFDLGMQAISLRPLLEDFLEHRRSYLVGSSDIIDLRFEPTELKPAVLADPRALSVILDNLCDNAAKYGGASAHTRLVVRNSPGGCAVSVEDSGIGFAPDQAPRLFEPFRRGLRARAQVQHGTGLGLAISTSLAIQMGGALSAHSDGPGQGSCFTLSLQGTTTETTAETTP